MLNVARPRNRDGSPFAMLKMTESPFMNEVTYLE